ncbi:MAG TPA: type I DNA topoisomerase [Candidatus Kapabacteria bacterium]|nr:type I DNA topoisomerase [Candidatus Kapabacteria bacterium]
MAKSLVIVESPAKAKTINKYLGSGYQVEASIGHIKDLPKSNLGVDLEHDFIPKYVTVKGKKELITRLKKLAAAAKDVYLATDPDREGEAIAFHIKNEIAEKAKNIKRVLFTEITKSGIQDAMKHPRDVDQSLYDAQQARRVMDRIIGYQVSPILWKAFVGQQFESLSAGRVQTVALRLICEREEAIDRFQPITYWNLWADFTTPTTEFPIHARLISVDNIEFKNPEGSAQDLSEELRKRFIGDETTARGYAAEVAKKNYRIDSVNKREVKRNAPPPFITSSMQTTASARLRYNPRKTMRLAQKLYEGIELGAEGLTGLITYMRTDSTRISDEARNAVVNFIRQNYGNEYVGAERKQAKSKNAQEAHEAIRPTDVNLTPKAVRRYLAAQDENLADLYELIWERFVASQMAPAVFDQTTVEIESEKGAGSTFRFRATGSVLKFRGYLQLLDDNEEASAKSDDDENRRLPNGINEGQTANIEAPNLRSAQTKAPPRYSESTLVKELESLGIGRPSTYASIVDTIQERGYVDQTDRRLSPTDLGKKVNHVLIKSFPEIFNVDFTARMEEELDTIATNERTYAGVMNDFYVPFKAVLDQVEERLVEELPKFTCPNCQSSNTEIKQGWFGMYIECRNCGKKTSIKSMNKPEPEKTGETCPECGEGELLIRASRYGKFIGCSRYPKCKYTRQIPSGIKCPKCTIGDIVKRRGGKRNSTFFGCSRYPDCDFISNYEPVNQTCPSCQNHWLMKVSTKTLGKHLKCPNCKKEFTEELLELSRAEAA